MSSPPSDRSLEGLIADNWGNHALRPDVLALLEPYRENAEYTADDFIDDEQSWRDYQAAIFGGSIPAEAMTAVDELLKQPYVAPIVIHACVESATTEQDWSAAHAAAREADPDLAPDAEVLLLVTHQANAADNGVWIVRPDGAHRRP